MAINANSVSPRGVAVFPKVVGVPDEYEGKKSWKLVLRLPPDQAKDIQAKVDAAVAEFRKGIQDDPNVKPADKKKILGFPLRSPVRAEVNRETGEETGNLLATFKTNYSFKDRKTGEEKVTKVAFFDAKGKPFTPKAFWGGSECKASYVPFVKANGAAEKIDVRLTLQAIQVFKLVAGGAFDAASAGFVAEEGFEASEDAAPETPPSLDEGSPAPANGDY